MKVSEKQQAPEPLSHRRPGHDGDDITGQCTDYAAEGDSPSGTLAHCVLLNLRLTRAAGSSANSVHPGPPSPTGYQGGLSVNT